MNDPADVAAKQIEVEEEARMANRVRYEGVSATHTAVSVMTQYPKRGVRPFPVVAYA